MGDFIDYSRAGDVNTTQEEGGASAQLSRKRSGRSKSSRRKSKAYEDLNEEELKEKAKENYQEPLGLYVGDWKAQGQDPSKYDQEEGYLGGGLSGGGANEKAAFARPDRSERPERRDRGNQDMGYDGGRGAGSGRPKDDGGAYYVPRNQQSFRQEKRAPKQDLGYDPNDRTFIHDQPIPTYGTMTFYSKCFLTGFQIGSFLSTLLAFNILVVISISVHISHKMNPFHKEPPRAKVSKEWETRISGERFSNRAEYYANFFGYECEDIDLETEDGYVLRMHHLTSRKHKALGNPVILMHGILSNSVTFMVNEERSLAFWLMEQGYDVFVPNIRANFGMPHRHFPKSDPRYWAFSIKEIGIYDLPAIIDYVYKRTGRKASYIGHSQGCSTMFLCLSRGMRPDIGNKMACFIALAPAVYAGPVLRSFPFSLMRKFKKRWMWKLVFGVREFIPIMSILQKTLPGWLFGHTAFPVFGFIFGFHDHNWLNRQIPKFFRSVPVANSSELLYYYMGNLSYNNCVFDTTITEPWFPRSFPPLAVFYGTLDFLVLGRPLVERIRNYEPNVRLVKAVALEDYEHQDPLWGVNAVQHVYEQMLDVLPGAHQY